MKKKGTYELAKAAANRATQDPKIRDYIVYAFTLGWNACKRRNRK